MLRSIKLATVHFNERLIQRFEQTDLDHLDKTIEKAMAKVNPGEKIRYTHPLWGITVVVERIGLNAAELITCWKGV